MNEFSDPKTLMILSLAGIILLTVVSISTKDVLGFLIGAALAVGLAAGGL